MTTNDPGAFDRAPNNPATRARGVNDVTVFGPGGAPPVIDFALIDTASPVTLADLEEGSEIT